MAESQTAAPTDNERAKFYLDQKLDHLTPMEVLGAMDGDTAEQNLRAMEIDFHEGVQRVIQNKRELGWSPVAAWHSHVDEDWPDWVKRRLADSEHGIFVSGMSQTDEEEEYIEFLEDKYDVPR